MNAMWRSEYMQVRTFRKLRKRCVRVSNVLIRINVYLLVRDKNSFLNKGVDKYRILKKLKATIRLHSKVVCGESARACEVMAYIENIPNRPGSRSFTSELKQGLKLL
jgi:hypothetical protein